MRPAFFGGFQPASLFIRFTQPRLPALIALWPPSHVTVAFLKE